MKIALRPATNEDLEWLSPFYEALMRPVVELTHPWDETKLSKMLSRGAASVVMPQGMDIGFFRVDDSADCIYLGDIQIHPHHQNKGIGTRLLRGLKLRAAREGRPIRLRVLKGNPAMEFYRRLGFNETIELDNCFEMEWCQTKINHNESNGNP